VKRRRNSFEQPRRHSNDECSPRIDSILLTKETVESVSNEPINEVNCERSGESITKICLPARLFCQLRGKRTHDPLGKRVLLFHLST